MRLRCLPCLPALPALGDVGALSYNYVVENSFFASLLAYQWIYYTDRWR